MMRLTVLRAIRLVLCVTIVATLFGCTTGQIQQTHGLIEAHHGYDASNVAIIVLSTEPEVALRRPWGKVKGTFIGVGKGALEALNNTLEAIGGSTGDARVDLFVLTVAYTITGPIYMVQGGVSGAREGLTEDEIEASAVAIGRALEDTDIQALITDRASRQLTASRRVLLVETLNDIPVGGYTGLRALGFDTVLELSELEVGLSGGDGADPPLSFFMNARARLVRTESNTVLFDKTFGYTKADKTFRQWAMNDAQVFREELHHAVEALASQAVMEAFDIEVTDISATREGEAEGIVSP